MRHSSRSLLSLCALGGIVAVSGWTSPARAADCTSDADCASGYECVKGVSTPGCAPSSEGGDCPDQTPIEAEVGSCEIAPIECTNDASACPEYLSCLESREGVCWASSDGSMGCSEPDPNAPKYCGFQETTCATDADCPREFECVESTYSACPAIDCAEGAECNSPCEPHTEKQCQPRQIECDDDTMCPDGWACQPMTTTTCATSGGTEVPPTPGSDTGGGSDSGSGSSTTTKDDVPAPDEPVTDGDVAPEDECVTTVVASYCMPETLMNFGYGFGTVSEDGSVNLVKGETSADDSGAAGAPKPEEPKAPHSKAKDDGGCSVAPTLGGSGSVFAPLMLLAPLVARIGRRRRAS